MKTPKYRQHSNRDVAFVEWQSKRHYLPGLFNSTESKAAYRAFLRENVFRDREPNASTLVDPITQVVTVAHVIAAFLRFAENRYPDQANSEYTNCRIACGNALMFAALPATEFGPLKLKQVQAHIMAKGVSAAHCNAQIARIRRAFKWAVSEELIPASVWHGLSTVGGLKAKRKKRAPVSWEHVQPVLDHLREPIRSMVLMQWHTGCRADSVCNATGRQFSRGETVWEWRPKHKTEHLGTNLVLPIGPQCQAVLAPFLAGQPDEFLFAPRAVRNSKRYRSHYDTHSYRQAIERGIKRANESRAKSNPPLAAIPIWTPHQLRHAKGHTVRDKYGVEAAQAILGHGSLNATEIYSERRLELAKQVALETG